MKLISWNVNGLRACMKKGFREFFAQMDADIFAIQETKMQENQLEEAMCFEGYHRYMNSAERKGYSGTLVYTKQEPLRVLYDIEGDETKEGRVISLEYPDFWFVCAYVPNSKEGLARLDYRVEWEG
jgi:exodeoxyribonuclease-3